jgi:type VI secretion system protein ImpF
MAQMKAQDRLQPALLDRLTDDDPGNPAEPAEMRVISRAKMRAAILRDLAWLLNTTFMSGDAVLGKYPEVQRSVVNFGLPALSGTTASSLDPRALEESVRSTIINFEPRVLAHSLKVEAVMSNRQLEHHNQISFRISGQLWAQPVPLELLLQTEIDLETGAVEIKDLAR